MECQVKRIQPTHWPSHSRFFAIAMGYFLTKLASSKQAGMDEEHGRKREKEREK